MRAGASGSPSGVDREHGARRAVDGEGADRARVDVAESGAETAVGSRPTTAPASCVIVPRRAPAAAGPPSPRPDAAAARHRHGAHAGRADIDPDDQRHGRAPRHDP